MIALITGASAGIGQELARLFAADRHDVILVARRAAKLEALADELQRAHDITAHVIPCDLGRPGGAQALVDQLEGRELRPDALVNNAGIGQSGPFAETDYEAMSTMVTLNITALTQLTRLLLPSMIERKYGFVLNVGSTAGFQPGPGMAVYYATKAYVYSFTEALVEELQGTGVTVTNLAPGATSTEFQDRAGIADTLLFASGVMEAQAVARAGYRGMLTGRSLVVPGLKNKVGAVGAPLVPRPLIRKVVARINKDR